MLRFYKTVSYTCYVNDFDTADRAWVPEVWAQETLAILEENMVIGQLVHTDFEDEIAAFGDTVNTRKPGEFTARRKGTNDDVTVQNATAVKVPVVLNQHVHTSFVIKDGEESKSFVDLIAEYLAPAAKSLAEHIDRVLLGQVIQFRANQVALDPVSPADDIKDLILDLREEMNINKVPVPGRQLILTTKTETEALKLDLFLSAEQVGDEGTALREASLGRKLGFDTYMCQNTPAILSGTYTDGTAGNPGSINNGNLAIGSTVFTMTSDSSAILPGMYVQFTDACGGFYRVTASGAATMTLDQGILQAIADDQLVRYYTLGAVEIDGDAAASAYPAGYSKPINVVASGVIPQVGQFVGFSTSGNVLYSGEYTIIDVSAGSGAGDYYITLDRPLDVALASSNGDKICYGPVGQYNMAFDRNAMALVVRPLALPMEGTGAKAGVATYNDLSLRVTITYEGRGQGHLVTLDLLCGVKVLDVDRGAMMTR